MPHQEYSRAAPTDVGQLGVYHLKRLWSRAMAERQGRQCVDDYDRHLDRLVIDAVGLGLEQTIQRVYLAAPTFEEFEQWVLDTTGGVAAEQVARINAAITGTEYPETSRLWLESIEASEPVLSDDDLALWDENGYIVLSDAVTPAQCAAAEDAIWTHLSASADAPESWYGVSTQGIMTQFFQHPALTATRRSARIHKAFAQPWGNADLWVTTDRCGFNVPEREGHLFPGPDLHWDVSLHQPIPFGTQGILYLTDTPPEQGALTVVPGFHRRIGGWLESLPTGCDPRRQDLPALGSRPIGGQAGDMVIWHHALPHGSRPDRGTRPRIVQYINMYPSRVETQDVWI